MPDGVRGPGAGLQVDHRRSTLAGVAHQSIGVVRSGVCRSRTSRCPADRKTAMIYTAPDPVASGKQFDVLAVHGRTPHVLDDFVGDATFTVCWEAEDRLITGCGHRDAYTVRFTEKDTTHGGKDVRVWSIGPSSHAGSFTASTTR